MQKGREVSDNIFEPRGFGDFNGFGFGRSMMPSLFGGRDPFDDPFFTDPIDSLFGPNSASRTMQKTNKDKGIVIQELDSDDEGADNYPETGDKDFDQKKSKSTMEPSVEHPDDDVDERKNSDVTYNNDHYKVEPSKARNFSFQTSRVTYGGINGAYYTSTRTRRMGSDGVVMEENKEADTTTGQATHRITRGIHDKGHSVSRKLDSGGKVDTRQTLHNLNEDELAGFEEAWKRNNMAQLPGFGVHGNDAQFNFTIIPANSLSPNMRKGMMILSVENRTETRFGDFHIWNQLEERENFHQFMRQEPIPGEEPRNLLESTLSEY